MACHIAAAGPGMASTVDDRHFAVRDPTQTGIDRPRGAMLAGAGVRGRTMVRYRRHRDLPSWCLCRLLIVGALSVRWRTYRCPTRARLRNHGANGRVGA
jgi:hypothetical protein